MGQDIHIKMLQSPVIGAPGSLEAITDALENSGREVTNFFAGSLVDEEPFHWKKGDSHSEGGFAHAYTRQEINIVVNEGEIDDGIYFVMTVELKWKGSAYGEETLGQLIATVDHPPMFTQQEFGSEQNCLLLLSLAKHWYESLKPKFGWVERCWHTGHTKDAHIEKLEVPFVYWANFFGLDYVSELGEGFLQNAPGHRTEFLPDGGCLYVLAPDLNRSRAGTKAKEQEVREYFGVEGVRVWPKKKKKKKSGPSAKALEEMKKLGIDPNYDPKKHEIDTSKHGVGELAMKIAKKIMSEKNRGDKNRKV